MQVESCVLYEGDPNIEWIIPRVYSTFFFYTVKPALGISSYKRLVDSSSGWWEGMHCLYQTPREKRETQHCL